MPAKKKDADVGSGKNARMTLITERTNMKRKKPGARKIRITGDATERNILDMLNATDGCKKFGMRSLKSLPNKWNARSRELQRWMS